MQSFLTNRNMEDDATLMIYFRFSHQNNAGVSVLAVKLQMRPAELDRRLGGGRVIPKSLIFIFYACFGGSECFHDVPGPPAINFALRNVQNGGLRSSLDNVLSFSNHFRTSRVPKFRTLFEKVDLIRPLRPKRSGENDPMLILSS